MTPAQLDARLRQLLAEGEVKRAATEAIRGYGPDLLRYLRGLLGNEADAQEAFSMASERLWRGLADFRGDSTLRTWCFRLAWSAAADLRKEAWSRRGRRLETREAEALATGDRTRSWLRAERLRLSFERLRQELTLEEQSLLQLRIDQRLSWAECAAILAGDGPPPRADALMKRFERVKARLAALAREETSR